MKRKATSGITLTLLLVGMLTLAFNIQPVKAEPRTWTVDDDGPADFTRIQDAINAASPGDTIYVYNGIYYEHLFANKDDLTIIGEDKSNTIVDGMGFGAVIKVWMNRVTISGFTVRNGSRDGGWWYHQASGIYLSLETRSCNISNNVISNIRFGIALRDSTNNTIKGNVISDVEEGISFERGNHNTIVGNNVSDLDFAGIAIWLSCNNKFVGNNASNNGFGIAIFEGSNNNTVLNNIFSNNYFGIMLGGYSRPNYNNTIYHNNFINNIDQANLYQSFNTTWDNGYPSGGNHWSDYVDVDLYSGPDQDIVGSDGIWDHPYIIEVNNRDNYPLVKPWTPSPTEAIQGLIETIEAWDLPKGTENSLTSKLGGALHLLDIGNENGALHKLMTFINQVEALRDKKLTTKQANQLITEAQRIIDLTKE